jgi:acyl transferase domain-containing protein/acyl carrier protein/SAM-dependent methyltransferase
MNRHGILRALQARTITPDQAKQMLDEIARSELAARSAVTHDVARERIAIVGMSGRYPGASSLDEFWELLAQGRSAIRVIPPSRWDIERYFDPRPQQPGKVYCKWLGMLDEVEYFDPLFFGISPAEAAVMDPQHRLFLQESYRALEDAGYAPSTLDGARCGVYLGIMNNEYVNLCQQAGAGLGETTGNSGSIAAARISYHLNLKGPAIAIDTACSSSLVATHLACQALLTGEVDLAIAGGVTLYLTPESYISMCGSGMLSVSGRCSAFDSAADGFVPGEAVGVLVLKRLSDAIAANDRIHSIVLGSGVNQDGRTNGITAPNVQSQIDLLREVYRRHAIDPASIGYVEAHGTGTRLGDPIEFEALVSAFRETTTKTNFCALGSVKSNIGHTSAAAGIASVHKAVLSMREKLLVPAVHHVRPNVHCTFEGSPFVINTELREWNASPAIPRRAAVSSFGYSGTNAHLVLEEWTEPAATVPGDSEPVLFVISARRAEELMAQCASLARFLARDPLRENAIPLSDVAFTLQVGRAAFEHRLAFVTATRRDAINRLDDFLSGRIGDGVFVGRVTPRMHETANDDAPAPSHAGAGVDGLREIAARWVRGIETQWRDLPRPTRVRLAHLPTYPFAKERCWVGVDAEAGAGSKQIAAPTESIEFATRATDTVVEVPLTAFDHLELLIPDTETVSLPQQSIPVDARVVIVGASEAQAAVFERVWPDSVAMSPPELGGVDVWAAALQALGRIDHIVWVAQDDGEPTLDTLLRYEDLRTQVLVCFHAIKALLDLGRGSARLEWTLITRDARDNPAHGALQGLVTSAVKEQPDWTLRLIDVGRDDALPIEQIAAIPGDGQCRLWAFRSGQWAREHMRSVKFHRHASGAFRPEGVYVIVGGAGGVGEVLTEYLLRRFRARVVWIGRRPVDGVVAEKLARLAALGPAPLYLQADATDPAALAQARATAIRAHGVVHGVIHSAIELHDRSIAGMEAADFEQTFAIKARIAGNIFSVFAEDALDFVLLFSSLASYSRDAGQSNYSAGSLYQDALARQMASRFGRRVKTINWGFWGEIGATAAMAPRVRERFAQAGVGALRPDEGMAALEFLMHSEFPQLAALHRLTPQGSYVAASTQPLESATATRDMVAAIDVEAYVKHTLLSQLAVTLKLAPERIDPDGAFADYGVDSISSVRIVSALKEALGIELAGTSLFDHSSVNKLVRHVLEDCDASRLQAAVAGSSRSEQVGAPTEDCPKGCQAGSAQNSAAGEEGGARAVLAHAPCPIAVVGMSGRFPKSDDLHELWTNLASGREVTEAISRWVVDSSSLPDGIRICPRGGFLSDIDMFDPLFFNISGTEATYMDPQHRLLLEESWHALEDAGYAGESITGARCGVYVGFNGGDYGELLQGQPSLPPHSMWGNAASVLSARIAYHLDLQGPAITLDTACSSSLVAVHLACQGLWAGETDIALAGGVWIQCTPGFLISSSRAGMLSPTGKCSAFGAAADGFVPSEGVGVVVLKRLQDALSAGDHIYGVIKGSAINQDGASNGITAPSAAAQERLERHVYDKFGIDPALLQLVEAHGTGTTLGDPIEAAALTRAFRRYTDRKEFCWLGSIKTNIGHTGAAAGVAGMIKVLLAMQHRQIPPSLHFDAPNPHIAFADSPFRVNTELRDWPAPAGSPRLAAVSSFGLSGTNAHMVVEEAPAPVGAESALLPTLLLVSAYRADDLPAQVEALAAYLERDAATHAAKTDLAAVGFTLAVGRRHHRHRLALVTGTAAQASAELRRWLAGTPSRVATAVVLPNAKCVELSERSQRCTESLTRTTDYAQREGWLSELAVLYVQGATLDFNRVFGALRRIPLPGYRFTRKRYWVPESRRSRDASASVAMNSAVAPATTSSESLPDDSAPAPAVAPDRASIRLHPFVHAVVVGESADDDGLSRFATHWTGQEFFLRDHVVRGAPMLPGAACLEMARAAASLVHPDQRVGQLRNVVWLRPLAVDSPVDVQIALEPTPSGELAFRVLSDGSETPHCQGRVVMGPVSSAPVVDIATILTGCERAVLTSKDYYAVFDAMGLSYGESYRCIERAFVGEDQILAQLRLPSSVEAMEPEHFDASGFLLHPSLLDSALQVSIGFEIGGERDGESDPRAGDEQRSLMLFALDSIEIFGGCSPQMWVWIRRERRQLNNKLNVDLCDPSGRVVARMQGVTSREARPPAKRVESTSTLGLARTAPSLRADVEREDATRANSRQTSPDAASGESLVGALTLAPAWESSVPPETEQWPSEKAAVVLIGGDETQYAQMKRHLPRAKRLPAAITDTADRAAEELRSLGGIEHLFLLVPDTGFTSIDSESLVINQHRGVMATFRLVKALLKLGFSKKPLGLTVITFGAQPVFENEAIDPTHAGVHGLIGTLAKEYPSWRVRLLDLQTGTQWPFPELLAVPADSDGNAWAYRSGRWHRQRWVRCAMPKPEQTAFRQKGVYVLIGGAGGIGEALSEYLIRNYSAQVVWIGLRKRDEVIQDKISRLSQLGPTPHYISADATDTLAMERASAEVELRFGTIHGVVHAALLMAGDPLERMDEQRFWRGLASKIEVSVRLAQAFAHMPLDFVLFFSSIQALEKTPRQANYAAGCTVEDAFAARLASEWRCTVRVVNWGYWGSVGFAATSSGYRNWIAQAGMGSVEPAEGMDALERLLAGPFRQLAFLKTRRLDALKGVHFSDDRLSRVDATAPIVLLDAPVDADVSGLIQQGLPERFEALLLELLCHSLHGLGVFSDQSEPEKKSRVVPQYRPWLQHTLALLAQRGIIIEKEDSWRFEGQSTAPTPWQEWERCAPEWRASANMAAPVHLAEATLRELDPVLSGQRLATDVLFPKASTHLVEGIYRDSPVPDFFNRALCVVIVRYIERRRRVDPNVRLRILEIGAGTGGTTIPLIRALAPFVDAIADYRFSDLSKAFVVAAERDYSKLAPYMSYGTFDVERAPASQGIGIGEFDIVVAANVLHATRDIRRTVRNAKATLKRNGMLLLNEVCSTSLFAHITFGLLKGWWLHEDAHLRIPGSPALSPESWCTVLAEEGFDEISLPAESARVLGQQIVVARSDGWIRQPVAAALSVATVSDASSSSEATPFPTTSVADDHDRAASSIRRVVRETLAVTLDIEPSALCDDVPLSDYGLDSMLAVQVVEILNTSAGTALTTTSLFDHQSIDALVAHILSTPGFASIDTRQMETPRLVASTSRVKVPSLRTAATERMVTVQVVVQALVDVSGIDALEIRCDVPFVDYGVDSMMAVQIVEALNRGFSVNLTTTSLFDHPTIDALVEHLAASVSEIAEVVEPLDQIQVLPNPLDNARQNGSVRARVLQELSAVLEIEAAEIDAVTPFTYYGLDSMLAVQWVERLNQALLLELTTTCPFDYPTLDALMQHILQGREEREDGSVAMEVGAMGAQPVAKAKRRTQTQSYTM